VPPVEITPGVHWIGVNDRTTDLFEGLWPITREGVSYNSYLVLDEKKAIIDLAKAAKRDDLLEQIGELTSIDGLDYAVLNHMEPDHTGALRGFMRIASKARIICTEKASGMLGDLYGVTDRVQVVGDGELISLGERALRFLSTPFVHWPETMMTYDEDGQTLFSCDAFGGYGALEGIVFDGDCDNLGYYREQALRYYVNIVALFSNAVLKAIDKLADLPVRAIAPSHGLIWRDDPGMIVELYRKWAGYADGPTEVGVTLVYGSMYGNTERMMNAVAQGIASTGVGLSIFDAAHVHPSYILPSLWTKRGVMIGAPTYEGGLFPPVAQVIEAASRKRIRNKIGARFGSYGWSGGAQREFERLVGPLKWELSESLEFAGAPSADDLERGEDLGVRFAEIVKDA
jgi:anaerobic nitric oxide reductase flavorubredoxin